MIDISNTIKNIRKKNKLSQNELGKILGISNQMVSKLENGKVNASEKIIKKLIELFPLEIYGYTREKLYTKNSLKEIEKDVIDTLEIMRSEKNIYSKIALINRTLIDLNKTLEEKMITLDTLIDYNNKELLKKIKNPLKTTVKNLTKYKNRLEEIMYNNVLEITLEDDNNGSN